MPPRRCLRLAGRRAEDGALGLLALREARGESEGLGGRTELRTVDQVGSHVDAMSPGDPLLWCDEELDDEAGPSGHAEQDQQPAAAAEESNGGSEPPGFQPDPYRISEGDQGAGDDEMKAGPTPGTLTPKHPRTDQLWWRPGEHLQRMRLMNILLDMHGGAHHGWTNYQLNGS